MKIKHLLFTLSILVAAATAYCQPSKFKITYSHNSNAEWAGSTLCLPGDQYLFNSYYGWQDGQGILLILVDSLGYIISAKVRRRIADVG